RDQGDRLRPRGRGRGRRDARSRRARPDDDEAARPLELVDAARARPGRPGDRRGRARAGPRGTACDGLTRKEEGTKKFLVLWTAWAKQAGDAIVDLGSPV